MAGTTFQACGRAISTATPDWADVNNHGRRSKKGIIDGNAIGCRPGILARRADDRRVHRHPAVDRCSPGGVGELDAPIPNDLAAAIRQLAESLSISMSSVLLAAHVKVLSALSGETDVVAGYVPAPVPIRSRARCPTGAVRGGTAPARPIDRNRNCWRTETFRSVQLAYELGVAIPPFETVVDPNGLGGEFDEGTVLRVEMSSRADRPVLRVRYRMDALDTGFAGRVAGYHLRALELMMADPDAEHDRQSLLSAEELDHQLEGLQGPSRSLPDLRFHELFERRVEADPHAVAGVQGDRQWTYGELNARANLLGRTLLAHGLRREDVVAVVTERNLDWMAAVIAVFKAGGVYLPIEPHFPADRIATTLTRAECRLVLTEEPAARTSTGRWTPCRASIRCRSAPPRTRRSPRRRGRTPRTWASSSRPANSRTSTSPRVRRASPRARCVNTLGMLNHLYAKIDDLQIAEGQVIAQTAPQCFDISLWQLVSGLLVGATTLLIEQEVILDVERFVDAITEGRVAVLQLVPSYLEVVLTFLEQQPRELPDLQCVSVTGEALKRELAQRWFAGQPGIKLVNAYGLTETSDDTNHEVMYRAPEGDRVPLGRPVNNVRIYVVDEHLAPVPLGAPGAIVFSGICVGRGYVNDPERTRQAFLVDPHRQGERLYQAGDYGRWLPDGKLEFLGRRDSQVKIRGFRIEIGEIDNALLRVPGVRDAAVVVAERVDHSRQLVAFYSAQHELSFDLLRDRLAASLPEYMVPSAFHWRDSLPLTANSKIDRKALTVLAGTLDVAEETHDAPATPTERRLVAAWSKVLGTPEDQIGRNDHFFFDCGGSSLSAVKLAITLDRAVSLTDVTRHPILADLAALIDGRTPRPVQHVAELTLSTPAATTN